MEERQQPDPGIKHIGLHAMDLRGFLPCEFLAIWCEVIDIACKSVSQTQARAAAAVCGGKRNGFTRCAVQVDLDLAWYHTDNQIRPLIIGDGQGIQGFLFLPPHQRQLTLLLLQTNLESVPVSAVFKQERGIASAGNGKTALPRRSWACECCRDFVLPACAFSESAASVASIPFG